MHGMSGNLLWILLVIINCEVITPIRCELPILVQQLCRHGDRTPIEIFPTSLNKNKWGDELSQLTREGRQQCYENGRSFREQWYPGLLSNDFNPHEIQVLSSEYDRTIDSALAFLEALYPGASDTEMEMWRDTTVNVIPTDDDYFLYVTNCPALDEELTKVRNSSWYKQLMAPNEDFVSQICELAGYKSMECTIITLIHIQDNLIIDELYGNPLPNWATDNVRIRLRNILNIHRTLTESGPSVNYRSAGGGALLGLMLESLEKKIASQLTEKLVFYSAHDLTISPFMATLGHPVKQAPSYASCVFLQLYHESSTERYYIQLLFKNSTIGQTQQPIELEGCGGRKCDASTFIELLEDKVNKNPEEVKEMSASAELAAKLEKRNKINEGELAPTMNEKEEKQNNETSASAELAAKLEKRNRINEGELAPTMNEKGISIYSENPNLSRKTIQHLDEKFKEVADKSKKSTLNLEELKKLFEGLGCPQTHLTLKGLLREANKDPNTGEVTFREFLAVFRKASSEEIDEESPLKQLATLNEIDVGEKGVVGAKEFFQAKMKASEDSSFAREVEQEKVKKAQEEEDAKNKQEAFNEIKAKFCTA